MKRTGVEPQEIRIFGRKNIPKTTKRPPILPPNGRLAKVIRGCFEGIIYVLG